MPRLTVIKGGREAWRQTRQRPRPPRDVAGEQMDLPDLEEAWREQGTDQVTIARLRVWVADIYGFRYLEPVRESA